jgi:hypothetical protein
LFFAQKTRPDSLAFLSDFVIDAVVDQFAREIVLECTRDRSREALYLLKEEREISRYWDEMLCAEVAAAADAALEELKAEQAALAKKAQPQVRFDITCYAPPPLPPPPLLSPQPPACQPAQFVCATHQRVIVCFFFSAEHFLSASRVLRLNWQHRLASKRARIGRPCEAVSRGAAAAS